MATNFEPHECVIFARSTKIGTHENKAIHSSTTFSTNNLQTDITYPVTPYLFEL